MAAAIQDAIERTGVLVAEAGTGTGKTFAYLVPALLAGGKVIVSTGTKTLQDQLYDRDLPAVREALACGTTAALLKGRANYVCLYRMKRAASPRGRKSRNCVASSALPPSPRPAIAPTWPTFRRTRQSGRTPRRRATTASGRNVPTTGTAS
jgi:Rad3-related DNA helicase